MLEGAELLSQQSLLKANTWKNGEERVWVREKDRELEGQFLRGGAFHPSHHRVLSFFCKRLY